MELSDMQQIIRWPPEPARIDHNTAKIDSSNYMYVSWSNPPWWGKQIVNNIFMPQQTVKILACRMLINLRTGTPLGPCEFHFRVIKFATGFPSNTLATTPPVLDATNTALFPLLVWKTVFTSPAATAPTVDNTEYLGIVFTKPTGVQSAANNFECRPLVEVLTDF
jgi:hypothetical protein